MNFVFYVHTCITRIPVLWDLLRGSVGLMHGRYRSPAGHSKLAHHAVCAIRPIIVRLMNYCHNNNNNNNNNNLICIAPACQMTSEALAVQVVLLNVWWKSSVLSPHLNPLRELQCNVSESNEFQTEGAQHRKARLAKCVLVVDLWSSGMVDVILLLHSYCYVLRFLL